MTLEALLYTAGRLADEGEIAGPDPARYLLACLRTALAHVRLDQPASAGRQLSRFLEGLDAHAGRGVSTEARAALRPAVAALLGLARSPVSANDSTLDGHAWRPS